MMRILSLALDQSTTYISRNEEAVNTLTKGTPGRGYQSLKNSPAVSQNTITLFL